MNILGSNSHKSPSVFHYDSVVHRVPIFRFCYFMALTTPLSTQVRLIDAGFLWTEPHSKRIKLKVTIQKEVRKQGK